MKVRSRLQEWGSTCAWVLLLPVFFAVSGIMLAGFLMFEFLEEQLSEGK